MEAHRHCRCHRKVICAIRLNNIPFPFRFFCTEANGPRYFNMSLLEPCDLTYALERNGETEQFVHLFFGLKELLWNFAIKACLFLKVYTPLKWKKKDKRWCTQNCSGSRPCIRELPLCALQEVAWLCVLPWNYRRELKNEAAAFEAPETWPRELNFGEDLACCLVCLFS